MFLMFLYFREQLKQAFIIDILNAYKNNHNIYLIWTYDNMFICKKKMWIIKVVIET